MLKDDSIHQINASKGLTSDNVNHILMDGQLMWIATNNGLNKVHFTSYDDVEYEIETYTTVDGLTDNEVTETALLNGRLWVATRKGLSVFYPDRVGPGSTPPPVYITDISNIEYSFERKDYNLTYAQNSFVISFIGLSYKDPGNLTYAYKMHGVDTGWHSTSNTSVQYTTLPQGAYEFQVKAINHDKYASTEAATVTFSIHPPFWHTWWFRLLYIYAAAQVIYMVFRFRVNQITKKAEEREKLNKKMAEMELTALRAQMNPHFIFNTMNSIQDYILKNDADAAQNYLSKFANLIRSILDNSQLGVITIEEEVKALGLYLELESLRFEEKIEYSILVDNSIDTTYDRIPVMLIQPYLENAIWHGLRHKKDKKSLAVNFEATGENAQS